MEDNPAQEPKPPLALEYQRPLGIDERAVSRRSLVKALAWSGGTVAVFIMGIALLLPALGKPRPYSQQMKCAANLKNIAAACIVYSNTHNGKYPDSFEEMLSSTGMTSAVMVCPESNDAQAPGTPAQQIASLSAGGHLSYIYLGKGLTGDSPNDMVLAYEPLANHHNRGINVLFNDYHVAWMPAAEAKKFIAAIVPGKPMVWPVKTGK